MTQDQKHIQESRPGTVRDTVADAARVMGWLGRWRPAAPVLLLFAIGVGSVFALIYFGGVSLDREAAQNSLMEVQGQLADRTKSLESISHDYAWWDEAVDNLAVSFSADWAKENIGRQTLTASYPQVSGALALDSDDRILYGFIGTSELAQGGEPAFAGGLDKLAAAARAGGGRDPKPVRAMLRLGDTVYLAAAAAVTPFERPAPATRGHPVVVMLSALDASTLDSIGATTWTSGLRATDRIVPGEVETPLVGADDMTLGYLAWAPPRPGRHLLDELAVPMVLVALLLAALSLIALDQILRARRAAESYAGLVAAKNASLQQAAGLLGVTVDAIDEGIVVVGDDGAVRHWNRTYERMWRFPPGGLYVGANLEDIIAWKRANGYELVEDDSETARASGRGTCSRLYRDEAGRLIEARRFRMPDGQGEIGVTRDLTEAKRREQALIEAREQALHANRAKSEFLANVSHELRTPLNAIMGFSEVLEVELYGPIESERYRSYIRDIRESGGQLLDLINDILDFSKIEAHKFELRLERCDCSAITRDAVRQIGVQAKNQGLDVAVDLPAMPVLILADGRALHRALLNLLSNAVKFTPSGGRVTVRCRGIDQMSATFVISDTGIGIAEADIEKAMAPFGQIDSDMARRFRGTGLGLSIVKGFIDLHGGTLDIASELGIGTTVMLMVPDQRRRTQRPVEMAPRVPAEVG